MHRLHDDDLRFMLKPEYRGYVMKWLETIGAAVVVPDQVTIPNNAMPGTFAARPGRFGQDEPWPPYEPNRQFIEDAKERSMAEKAAPDMTDAELRKAIETCPTSNARITTR